MSEDFQTNLPARFVKNVKGLHGAAGENWLADLPRLLGEISGVWSLQIGAPFVNLTFNYVAACTKESGEECVLKICAPEENPPIFAEKKALQAFDGRGAVKVFKYDEIFFALLVERAAPGVTLAETYAPESVRAVSAAIDAMKALPREPQNKNEFPLLDEWTNDLAKARKTNFEPRRIEKASAIFKELRQPFETRILLHGDVHFDNILSATRAPFLLIDPKGCVGEIGYEIAVFLNDLCGWTRHLPEQKKILARAVEQFSGAFDLETAEIKSWAFAQAMLAAFWMYEDFGRDWENFTACAKMWEL